MKAMGFLPDPALSADMVSRLDGGRELHVWLVDARSLSVAELESRVEAVLAGHERERAAAMPDPQARRDHLAGRLALRSLLSAYQPSVAIGSWRVSRNSSGRPAVSSGDPVSDGTVPAFSIAHSGGMLALALYRGGEPGVDIEPQDREVDAVGLARRHFSQHEVDALQALPDKERLSRFLQYWTLKEASVKADGVGLAGELSRRSFSLPGDRLIRASRFDARHWQYWSWSVSHTWWLAVALRHSAGQYPSAVCCRQFSLSLADGEVSGADIVEGAQSAVL